MSGMRSRYSKDLTIGSYLSKNQQLDSLYKKKGLNPGLIDGYRVFSIQENQGKEILYVAPVSEKIINNVLIQNPKEYQKLITPLDSQAVIKLIGSGVFELNKDLQSKYEPFFKELEQQAIAAQKDRKAA